MRKIKQLVIHHTAGHLTDTPEMVRKWHRQKGFTDSLGHSGYHFFLLADGRIVPDRPEEEWGCNVANFNQSSIGICLTGNFNEEYPTEAQINSLLKLLIELVKKHDLKYWNIYGHRDIKQFFIFNTTRTACPGDHLYSRLKEIRQRVALAITAEKSNDIS